MTSIPIQTGRPYQVLIDSGNLSGCGQVVRQLSSKSYAKIAIITDQTVNKLYGTQAAESFRQAGYIVEVFSFPPGEASKDMANLKDILGFLADQHITRSDLLVALGGGVVGDITGFAAAVYQRGMDYIQIPTTLLAAIDSSVGGKTAVNIPQGKNLAGCFWQPSLVYCDVQTLSTLDQDYFIDGVAEAIKYGCIWDKALFHQIASGNIRNSLPEIIARCVEIKAQIVREDERDVGVRQILNFGHTLGHAVEKLSKYTISHGKAVAIGMACMARAGEAAGITRDGTSQQIIEALRFHQLPHSIRYTSEQLSEACLGDKKRSGDIINLILLQEIGKYVIHPVSTDYLFPFLSKGEDA